MSDTAMKLPPPATTTGAGDGPTPNLGQGMTLSLDTLQHFVDQIAECDKILDAATGVRGDVAIRNKMAETVESLVSPEEKAEAEAAGREPVPEVNLIVDDLSEQLLADKSGEELVGWIFALHRRLSEKYKEEISAAVNAVIEAEKVSGEKPSDDAVQQAAKRRSELLKVFRASKETLRAFGFPVDQIEEPKGRRGSVGKRAVQAWLRFQYFVDGTAMVGKENSLKGVSEKVGAEKVSELKDAYLETVKDQPDGPTKTVKGVVEIDLKKLPPEFEFTYNGHNIKAIVLDRFKNPDGTVASDDVSDEDDSDESMPDDEQDDSDEMNSENTDETETA